LPSLKDLYTGGDRPFGFETRLAPSEKSWIKSHCARSRHGASALPAKDTRSGARVREGAAESLVPGQLTVPVYTAYNCEMDKSSSPLQPLYLKVKRHILDNIGSGKWATSARVPSENDIVKSFGVSRMTANRALRELRDEGVLVRIAGVGSFVADRHARAHPLEIRSIADEIRERGHVHRAETVSLERIRAVAELAEDFGVAPRSELYCSVIVHFENDRPVQLEDRYVLPKLAPDYLKVDFALTTPHDYLTKVAPLQEAEHLLRAVMPDERTRKLLAMKRDEPCLLMIRRTWTAGQIASVARLYYPGSRYEMSGRFRP
jgi:GntR family transcriptional regulator, histidine utilization repressor